METLNETGTWTWANIMGDLEMQGGLPDVVINPLSMNQYSCAGKTASGTGFFITWVNAFIAVS